MPTERHLRTSDTRKCEEHERLPDRERERFSLRQNFGRGFRRPTKREKKQDQIPEEVYRINHLFSSKVSPKGKESLRITLAKPIRLSSNIFCCIISLSPILALAFYNHLFPLNLFTPCRKGQQQFVITCVNSSSMAEATVQLWGCTQESFSYVSQQC